jgi:hypothetical protein
MTRPPGLACPATAAAGAIVGPGSDGLAAVGWAAGLAAGAPVAAAAAGAAGALVAAGALPPDGPQAASTSVLAARVGTMRDAAPRNKSMGTMSGTPSISTRRSVGPFSHGMEARNACQGQF